MPAFSCTQTSLTFARMATDHFQSPDYFLVDELLTEEHKLIREREEILMEVNQTITGIEKRETEKQLYIDQARQILKELDRQIQELSNLPGS